MSILVVDDSASQRLLLTSMLKAAGHTELLPAQSAQDAFRLLGMNDPGRAMSRVDLILMDLYMPEIDGVEACRRIKATDGLQDIPIMMVTVSAEDDDLQLAFDAGAMDYVTKPPNKVELLARVASALKLKNEMDARKAREKELTELTQQLTDVNERLEEALVHLDEQHQLLEAEQQKSERLLLNILPRPIADRLKTGSEVIAESFSEVGVLFADIVDFSRLSATLSPRELVTLLNEVFREFDRLAEKHGLEKIKTIGDAYMVVGGLPEPRDDHLVAIAEMALDMQKEVARISDAAALSLHVRIGIHSGPVVAGVIGTKKFAYDLWGDTVNIASRMESHGVAGQIQVSPQVYQRLSGRYSFQERGKIGVKGLGEIMTYFLCSKIALGKAESHS